MKKTIYKFDDAGITGESVVYETKRQRDILDVLEELIENAEIFGWFSVFNGESFYIEYSDGSTYEASDCGEYGIYKKKGIKRIIYTNPNDTQVFGEYSVNEWGNVF